MVLWIHAAGTPSGGRGEDDPTAKIAGAEVILSHCFPNRTVQLGANGALVVADVVETFEPYVSPRINGVLAEWSPGKGRAGGFLGRI